MTASTETHALFPTPVSHIAGALDAAQVRALLDHLMALIATEATANQRSTALTHTRILAPEADPVLQALAQRLLPHVAAFGTQLFGETLAWTVKELWANVLQTGGFQGIHNHANCFVSGVLYLTPCHPATRTLFTRSLGGRDFVFTHAHPGVTQGPFNAGKWAAPQPQPGDLLLFPSYLLHEVPVNPGPARVSLAFNAIPQRLEAHGYALSFSS